MNPTPLPAPDMPTRRGRPSPARAASLLVLLGLAACQNLPAPLAPPPTSPEAVGEFRAGSGYLKGYLGLCLRIASGASVRSAEVAFA